LHLAAAWPVISTHHAAWRSHAARAPPCHRCRRHTEFHKPPAVGPVVQVERVQVELLNLVFVSHTSQDDGRLSASRLARGIADTLIDARVPTFFDATALTGGVKWAPAIEASAASAQVFVAIISPSYLKRYWCMRELGECHASDAPAHA
jgi:hypothetical protein